MSRTIKRIAVMTSGGDAQGMNAAVRAVIRTGIALGVEMYAIREGYQGLVENHITKMVWDDVSSILERGGTTIGTARCRKFQEHEGMLQAAANLVKNGIANMVIIGGDGSLSGADELREKWPELLKELVKNNIISTTERQKCRELKIVGMVGSIDNDMADTDMTIGADSALHRITEAIDSLSSTAHSHQRIFVVEVMGRHCGYLALMSGVATGAGAVFVPEFPPKDGWEQNLCEILLAARNAGRRDSIIIVAEGAVDRQGKRITSNDVKSALDAGMGTESRITILGHVQRGGSPSAYDRYLGTVSGVDAVRKLLADNTSNESSLVIMRDNRIKTVSLMAAVKKNHAVTDALNNLQFINASIMRGTGWRTMARIFRTLCLAIPSENPHGSRVAVITSGWPAPGMNSAVRTAVRIGMDQGHTMLGIRNGMEGLIEGDIFEFDWMEVEEWNSDGGSRLGANRKMPENSDFYSIACQLEKHRIQGMLIVGGWPGYESARRIELKRREFPGFNIPIVCIPASINNNLPGSELAIGADTALNTIVEAVDKIKHSADNGHRAFIVEVMGRYCGYLALMSGLATGAEFIYLHEQGVTLDMLRKHVKRLTTGFNRKRRSIALIIRNENANHIYSTDFIRALFEEEGGDAFDVRKAILGPMQQGGSPSPFDRVQATRLAYEGITRLLRNIKSDSTSCSFIGQHGGKIKSYNIRDLEQLVSAEFQRPRNQWWEKLIDIVTMLAIRPDGM